MTARLTIYHNPRCSKSRAALSLLQGAGHAPHVVRYLETPPTEAELGELLRLLKMSPRDLVRRSEAVFNDLGLDDDSLADEQLLAAMAAHPELIERPIVVAGERAIIARPPERALDVMGLESAQTVDRSSG